MLKREEPDEDPHVKAENPSGEPMEGVSAIKSEDGETEEDEHVDAGEKVDYVDFFWNLSLETQPSAVCVGGERTAEPCFLTPGVSVEGFGVLGLPLSEPEAKRLAQVAEKAPFGRGLSTLVDETVRKTWQIDASKVKITHPQWKGGLSRLTQVVASELGCPNPHLVKASLHKLLLYDAGGFFKVHRDTEKEPGMFATMVVQLPTKFSGGALTVTHKSVKKVFDFSEMSGFSAFYTAFYCDCEHEISEVTQGHRLCLVYNLVWSGQGPAPSIAPTSQPLKRALRAVRRWEADANCPTKLIHVLEHEYTMQSLSMDQLKGDDRRMGSVLAALEAKGAIKVYLAFLERSVHEYGSGGGYSRWGEVDYDDVEWEESESSTTLTNLVGAEDDLDEATLEPKDEEFLDEEWRESLGDPVEEDYEGNLGNESATRDTVYRVSVLVFWPVKFHASTMLQLGDQDYSLEALHAKIGPDGKIEQALLPLGITSARDWLDAAIRQECRPVAASPYRYNGHGHLAPASRAELLAMQAMAKMGTADDVLKLLKSFKLLQTASADLIKVAADKAGWEALGPVLLDMLKKETKASASIEKTTEALKKLAESLPQGRAVWASVLSELGARLLALPMTQPQTAPYGLSYGYGSAYGHAAHAMLCTPAAFALLYRTLADMQLDDQAKALVDAVTANPSKYKAQEFVIPALLSMVGGATAAQGGAAQATALRGPTPRCPHVDSMVQAALAAFASPPKEPHAYRPELDPTYPGVNTALQQRARSFADLYTALHRLDPEGHPLSTLVDGVLGSTSTKDDIDTCLLFLPIVRAKGLATYPHLEKVVVRIMNGISQVTSATLTQDRILALLHFLDQLNLPAEHLTTLCTRMGALRLKVDQALPSLLLAMAAASPQRLKACPAFTGLVRSTVSELEAKVEADKNSLVIPFTPSCRTGTCDICTAVAAFCSSPHNTYTEIYRAAARSKRRNHLMDVMAAARLSTRITVGTHTNSCSLTKRQALSQAALTVQRSERIKNIALLEAVLLPPIALRTGPPQQAPRPPPAAAVAARQPLATAAARVPPQGMAVGGAGVQGGVASAGGTSAGKRSLPTTAPSQDFIDLTDSPVRPAAKRTSM